MTPGYAKNFQIFYDVEVTCEDKCVEGENLLDKLCLNVETELGLHDDLNKSVENIPRTKTRQGEFFLSPLTPQILPLVFSFFETKIFS